MPTVPVGEFLDSITKDDELKIILAALLPWYHDDPYTTSLVNFAVGQASYFMGGGYSVKGDRRNSRTRWAPSSLITAAPSC
ncbi:MAG: hypothetical protein EFT35_09060 [Methanophagales archaeon ANME-1-THS]|nr:MAG: hypothetical protein EFT35_09060 [Methanophagales archaeon ANME-1-THS]